MNAFTFSLSLSISLPLSLSLSLFLSFYSCSLFLTHQSRVQAHWLTFSHPQLQFVFLFTTAVGVRLQVNHHFVPFVEQQQQQNKQQANLSLPTTPADALQQEPQKQRGVYN